MAVTAWQTGILGPYGPDAAAPVPVGLTTVNSTNPNPYAVNVTPSNSVSNATITNVKVNGVTVGAVGGVAYVVPGNATFQTTYASGTTTYVTAANPGGSAVNPTVYPYTDPVFQNFTAQQYLTQPGVIASGTYT